MSGPISARTVVWVLCLSVACGGAAKITFDPTAARTYAPKDPTCEIEGFEADPNTDYVEVGIIHYHHERHRASDDDLELDVAMPEIKKRACQVGADAIIDVHVTDRDNLEWRMFHVMARAIRFES